MNPSAKERFDTKYSDYEFVNGVPKQMMFVKLNPDITKEQRLFIANTIRSLFRDQVTLFMDTT